MFRNEAVIKRLLGNKSAAQEASALMRVVKYLGLNKKSINLTLRIFLVAFSMASAHYSGFISHMPFEFVSLVAVDMLPSFISVFVFYFIMCYSISRVFAFGFSQIYLSLGHALAAFVLRLRRHWPKKFNKSGRKMFKESIRYEPLAYWFLCLTILFMVFNYSYLKFEYGAVGDLSLMLMLGVITALVLKSGLMARSPRTVLKRLLDRKRVALRRSMLKAFIYFLTGGALSISFYTGYVRYDKILKENEVYLEVGKFTGEVNVLMSANGSLVAVDQKTAPETYYFLNDKLLVRLQGSVKDESKEYPSEKPPASE